jgi:hypothetical protein
MELTRTEERPATTARSRGRLPEALRWGGGAWLILRVIASLAAWASVTWLPTGSTVGVPGYAPPVLHGVLGILVGTWLRADALWYLRIAKSGYRGATGSYAFLPLFPLLVRFVTPLTGGQGLYAALLVSNAACLLGFVWLYGAVEALAGTSTARAAVIGLAVFPTAFFLVAPYGEPLLLAAGAGALLAAARGRPALAGIAGALAAVSRPFGVLIALPLAAFVLMDGHWRKLRWWLVPVGPAVGLVAWLAWSGNQLGNFLGALRVQSVWQRTLMVPWGTLDAGVRTFFAYRGTFYGPYMLMDVVAAVFGMLLVVGAVALLWRRKASPWLIIALALYGIAVLAVPMSSPFLPRPLMSMPRFVLALFPLFMAYGLIRPRLRIPLAVLSAAGLALATALYVGARPIF